MTRYVCALMQFEAELERSMDMSRAQAQEFADRSGGDDQYSYEPQEGELLDDGVYDEGLEDDEEYDEDYDEELSSSPSIPDENINFDLVYALHTFVATVDGQATVQKGDHLVLLDDSNSYWWLVRVMASQEVGYIPAENIETPYERLARLNKHRNVQITTATDDDHETESRDAYSGVLVKARARGTINALSGKPSALSSRDKSGSTTRRPPREKRAVLFGESEYVEHSGNEASDDDEGYEYEAEYDEEYDEGYDEDYDEREEEQEAAHVESQVEAPRDEVRMAAEQARRAADAAATTTGAVAAAAPAASEALRPSPAPRASPVPPTSDTERGTSTKSPLVGLFPTGALGPDNDMPATADGSVTLRSQDERKMRPGSLVGMPGSVPMFNVVRVFAGENVESDATFKTVLLNKTMTATDLVRQAMQRFVIDDDAADYAVVLRRLDGEEHTLWPHESPLQILESLSELQEEDRGPHGTPVQSRDSVGSLTSLLQDTNASRVTYDFSDDRYGKFYLVRKGPYFQRTGAVPLASSGPDVSADLSARSGMSATSGASDSVLGASSTMRFTLQVALFPSDLPDGVVFHPQTGLATPQDPQHAFPASATPQIRLLRFTRNTTVAEVIEASLASFQVLEGVVDGGDDVETRTGRGRVKYGLASVTDAGEQTLHPTAKVLTAYDTLPSFRQVDVSEVRRRSLEQTLSLGAQEDLNEGDPLFVLRQVRLPVRGAAFSPTPDTPRASHAPASPRYALSPRPTVEHNDAQGVDLVMQDGVRLRSSRTLDSPRVRYSLLSQGSEQDVSNRLRGVLETITRPDEMPSPSRGIRAGADVPPAPAASQGDLLERFAEQLPSMGDNNVSDNIDRMLRGIMQSPLSDPAASLPLRTEAVPSPQTLPVSAYEQTRGLNIPNKMTALAPPPSLQRTGSMRSVSASDAAAPRNTVARNALAKGWTGDRVVSDSTAATGTRRLRETYNIHALYGIVDALVIEAKAKDKAADEEVPLNAKQLREHRRQTSTSSIGSAQAQLQRVPNLVAKLLEPTPAEKVASASQGLFALPFPAAQHSFTSRQGSVPRHYSALISQIVSLEAALDELLRTARAQRD